MSDDSSSYLPSGDIIRPDGARVVIARDLDDLSRRAADLFVTLARRDVERHGRCTIALSGGETPKRLYSLLAEAPYRERVPWSGVHIFWGDERHVPPDHPDSDYLMAYQSLLSRVDIPQSNIHRVHAEIDDAAEAARLYEDELRSNFALGPDELPRFDLILLGMGPDGHTASLFPGTAALHDTGRVAEANWVEKLDAYRITLSPATLNNGRVVVFLVSGAGKADTLREVLYGESRPELYPSQLIAPTDGALIWLVDEAAAARLPRGQTNKAAT